MQQPLFQREGLQVALSFRMGQRLIDEEEFDALSAIIAGYRLQTGDVSAERRSRQAAEGQHRVMTAQARRLQFLAIGGVKREVWQRVPDRRLALQKLRVLSTGLRG